MTTHFSPVQFRMPAIVAAGWPKRRENRISFTAGLRSISRKITRFGIVGRRIKRKDDFVANAELFHHRFGALQERPNIAGFLINRDHDGQSDS